MKKFVNPEKATLSPRGKYSNFIQKSLSTPRDEQSEFCGVNPVKPQAATGQAPEKATLSPRGRLPKSGLAASGQGIQKQSIFTCLSLF